VLVVPRPHGEALAVDRVDHGVAGLVEAYHSLRAVALTGHDALGLDEGVVVLVQLVCVRWSPIVGGHALVLVVGAECALGAAQLLGRQIKRVHARADDELLT
jgi:hypothetical protein